MHPRRFAAATPNKPANVMAGSGEQVKVPRRYVFRQTLERTDAGKLVKRRLREALIAEDATGEMAA